MRPSGHEEDNIDPPLESLVQVRHYHRRADGLVLDVNGLSRSIDGRDVLVEDAAIAVGYGMRLASGRRSADRVNAGTHRPCQLDGYLPRHGRSLHRQGRVAWVLPPT